MIRLLLFFVLGWSLLIASAEAMEFERRMSISQNRNKIVLIIHGAIEEGDSQRLAGAIRLVEPEQIWLDSPGGLAEEGFKLGRVIRRNRLDTRVPTGAQCASACVHAFMGGVVRNVDQDRSIGIHMGSIAAADPYRRVPPQMYEQLGAITTAEWALYLQEMGISMRFVEDATKIEHSGIYWLTRRQMADYNLINEVE